MAGGPGVDQLPGGTLDKEVRVAQSELSSMSHGYHSRSEWDALHAKLADLLYRADMTQRIDLVMRLSASQALVQGQALGQPKEAAALLQGVLNRFDDVPDPQLRRIYVQLADLHADMGDEPAVARLIKTYRSSMLYDPDPFKYSGGSSPSDPIRVIRAHAKGDPSLTVTAMENSRKRALLSKGRLAEDFAGLDVKGRSVELRQFRGHMVLLDFYHPRWPGRAESLPRLKQVFETYRAKGFYIVGIPLVKMSSKADPLPWIQLAPSRSIASKYQVFGEATNFLIDQDGRIVKRNVSPDELRRLLAELLKTEL